jgi:recombinational DNA repair ATPase RecF
MIEKIRFEKFTAFEKLEVDFSPGINIFVGENGTGKTHILKAVYCACDITKSQKNFAEKINKVFFPSGLQIGRLAKRASVSTQGYIELHRRLTESDKKINIRLSFSNHTKLPEKAKISGAYKQWMAEPLDSVYIRQ